LMFTKDQLEKITKVAHADHMMGPLSARMAFPFDLLVRSLCPGIIGHDCVKAGLLLALLGGTPPSSSGLEDVKSGLTIRSNIHCLIVGDPGMGTLF
jgi:DNA helicase MCM8